jgi:hypothetical protein
MYAGARPAPHFRHVGTVTQKAESGLNSFRSFLQDIHIIVVNVHPVPSFPRHLSHHTKQRRKSIIKESTK